MKNVIDVYIYKDKKELLQIEPFFTNYRMEKINNTKNNKVIKENIITEHFLKTVLNNYNINLKHEKIIKKYNGKPYLLNNKIFYNISHSNGLFVIAVAKSDLSIDIEYNKINRINIAKRIYNNIPKNLTNDQLIKDFVIKESFIKYYGMSIYNNLKDILINTNKINYKDKTINYKLYEYKDYYISVTNKNEFETNFYYLSNITTSNLINYNEYIKIIKSDE